MRREMRAARGLLCVFALLWVMGCDGDDDGPRADAGDVGQPTDVVLPDVRDRVDTGGADDVRGPDAAVDAADQDIAVPDAAVPDAAMPDVAIPDVAVPDVAIPDVAIPDVPIPDVAIPDVALPDVGDDVPFPGDDAVADAADAALGPDLGGPLGAKFGLEEVVAGLTSPVALATAGDASGRLFVVDQVGVIHVIQPDGTLADEPFLELRDRIVELNPDYDERGLLGLAFHPDYATNGRFYVYYSAPLRPEAPDDWNHTSHLSEFQVMADDPSRADPTSERILLQVDQPQSNHNAGTLAFGPDGMLFLSLGDGGGANDTGLGHPPQGNGQDTTTLLGSVLRLDVDGGDPYGIPADNPFVAAADDVRDEIWAYGFRNPYRFSFVPGTADLLVGDAGQELWEEVSLVQRGGNYGWNIREGTHCFDPDSPMDPPVVCAEVGFDGEPLIDPVVEFANAKQAGGLGLVVVGGHLYQGDLPELQNRYVFAAFAQKMDTPSGIIMAAQPQPLGTPGLWPFEPLRFDRAPDGVLPHYVQGFGEDEAGALYVLTKDVLGPTGDTGRVLRFGPSQTPDEL